MFKSTLVCTQTNQAVKEQMIQLAGLCRIAKHK